jgi:hypothetical protein
MLILFTSTTRIARVGFKQIHTEFPRKLLLFCRNPESRLVGAYPASPADRGRIGPTATACIEWGKEQEPAHDGVL